MQSSLILLFATLIYSFYSHAIQTDYNGWIRLGHDKTTTGILSYPLPQLECINHNDSYCSKNVNHISCDIEEGNGRSIHFSCKGSFKKYGLQLGRIILKCEDTEIQEKFQFPFGACGIEYELLEMNTTLLERLTYTCGQYHNRGYELTCLLVILAIISLVISLKRDGNLTESDEDEDDEEDNEEEDIDEIVVEA